MPIPDVYADRLDLDPPPRRSPRLYAEMGEIPGAIPTARARPARLTPARKERLVKDMAVYLLIEGGMSFRMVASTLKRSYSGIRISYARMVSIKSRV